MFYSHYFNFKYSVFQTQQICKTLFFANFSVSRGFYNDEKDTIKKRTTALWGDSILMTERRKASSIDDADKYMNSSMQPLLSSMQTVADVLDRIMRLKIEESRWREGTEAQRKLAAWYDKGGGFQCVKVSNAAFDAMRTELRIRRIRYIPLAQEDGRKLITFRSCDEKEMLAARDSILLRRSCYLKQVTGHELIHTMEYNHKEAVFFEGLSKEESAYIKSQCRSIGSGVLFAQDRMRDGTFRVGCGSPDAVQLDPDKADLGKATLAACLALEGSDQKILKLPIRAELRFEREARTGFHSYGGLEKGPLYITGRNELDQYICISKKGFSLGTVVKLEDGTTTLVDTTSLKANEPGYKAALEAAYAKIESKVIFTQEDELIRHLETNALDPRAEREAKRNEAVLTVANAVDRLIKTNSAFRQTARDDISVEQKLSEYRNEAVRILESVRTGSGLRDYSKENMDALGNLFEQNEIPKDSLRDVSRRLFEIEPVVRSADHERESIDEMMNRADEKVREASRSERGRRGRYDERDEQEKGGRVR